MTGRILLRYIRDRAVLLLAYGLNTLLLLGLGGLLLAYGGVAGGALWGDLLYGLLLAATLLALLVAVDLIRRWPFAAHMERLLTDQDGSLERLTGLPAGAEGEQAAFGALLDQLYSRAAAERHRYEEAHQRQLAFMNLWVHQMKTPVSAISLIAQQEGATFASVEEDTAKLADGLELVLNMARLQDFALDYHIRRTDLLRSVRKIINSRKKQFIRLGIFPEVTAHEGQDWHILTDEKWNGFVIDQIIANALKYGAQGGAPGQKLRLSLAVHPQAVTLTIADEGPGIPPQDLPRVFEPFFTGENGRRYADATGVGLYLVKQVVDRLGHTIAIESEQGQGTTVTLTYNLTKL